MQIKVLQLKFGWEHAREYKRDRLEEAKRELLEETGYDSRSIYISDVPWPKSSSPEQQNAYFF